MGKMETGSRDGTYMYFYFKNTEALSFSSFCNAFIYVELMRSRRKKKDKRR